MSNNTREILHDLKYYELINAANTARLALAGCIDHQVAIDLLDSVLGEIGKEYVAAMETKNEHIHDPCNDMKAESKRKFARTVYHNRVKLAPHSWTHDTCRYCGTLQKHDWNPELHNDLCIALAAKEVIQDELDKQEEAKEQRKQRVREMLNNMKSEVKNSE